MAQLAQLSRCELIFLIWHEVNITQIIQDTRLFEWNLRFADQKRQKMVIFRLFSVPIITFLTPETIEHRQLRIHSACHLPTYKQWYNWTLKNWPPQIIWSFFLEKYWLTSWAESATLEI